MTSGLQQDGLELSRSRGTHAATTTATPRTSTGGRPVGGLQRILRISSSLVGTQAATAVLGLLFWTIASRGFVEEQFGIANAAISAMSLLGALGTLGLGTLLISVLPGTEQGRRRVTVRTALAVSAAAATALAVVVPLIAIHVLGLGNLAPIAGSAPHATLFAIGVGLAAVAIVVDQAVLVLGSGALQLERNVIASFTKVVVLLALVATGLDEAVTDGMAIFAAWAVGTAVSLPLLAHRTRGGRPLQDSSRLLDLSSLSGLGRRALSHHALNTTLQSPLMLLPVIVTASISAGANAPFAAALQLTGFVFALPYALSVGLFAAAEGDDGEVLRRMRVTIPLGLGVSVAANLALLPLAPFVLRIFGESYAADGTTVLRVLVLAGLPFVVKDHFVALRRVQGRTGQATSILLVCTVLELAAALVGARLGGVIGLTVAWVAVLVLEALVLAIPLVRAARTHRRTEAAEPGGSPARRTGGAHRVRPDRDAPRAVVEPPARPRRIPPAGAAFLAFALGLLALALAVQRARAIGNPDGWAQFGWEAGLVLLVAPAALVATWPRISAGTRIAVVLTSAMALQLSRVVLYPDRFMFHDELLHGNLLRIITETGELFGPNPLLPITSFYPGLEIVTDGVGRLTGLGAHPSAVLVLLAARFVLAAALALLVVRLTRSARAGAIAVVVYSCNPQMLFFNSQFSYQTLALPLAVFTVVLFLGRDSDRRRGLVAPVVALAATVVTHHVTAVLLIAAFAVWLVLELVLRRRREPGAPHEVGPLALMTAASAVFFGLTLAIPGNTLTSYLGSIVTSSAGDLGALAQGRQTKALFANTAGVGPAPWEQVLLLGALLITVAALLPSLWAARRWWRSRVTAAVLLALLAVLYPGIPGGHVARATAEVGDRASGFVFVGIAFVVASWLVASAASRRRAVVFTLAATFTFLGSVVLGSGTVRAQLPGPFLVSADARSIDADNLAAAAWMRANLSRDNPVYADRVTGLLAAADGGQFTVRHISTEVDASRLLLDPEFTAEDVRLIREVGIRYLIVDRRDAFGLPNQGVYVESGEFGSDTRTEPVPAAALAKFDDVAGVDRIYDNGSIVIYDLTELAR